MPAETRRTFRVSPAFLLWMESLGMNNATANLFSRHRSRIELRNAEEAETALTWLDAIGDQSFYTGHRGSSVRGFFVRRLARRIEKAQDAGAFDKQIALPQFIQHGAKE